MTLIPFARRLATPFSVNPLSGRTQEEGDYAAHARQLIRSPLLTSPGERVNRADFGAGVRRMVFRPLSNASALLAKTMILDALSRWLSTLIEVNEVSVEAQTETLLITVTYRVIPHGERRDTN